MNHLITRIKTVLATKPSNAFLLFLTGFFFAQFMLVNILYTKNPLGGWVTPFGTITTPFILLSFLLVLSLCLIFLWRSVNANKQSKEPKVIKASIVKTQDNYSTIDYPRGSTKAVVSGYALG